LPVAKCLIRPKRGLRQEIGSETLAQLGFRWNNFAL
jgi:hypothetical protein